MSSSRAFILAFDVLQEQSADVTAGYLLVQTIFRNFYYPAEVFLLATIYGLIFQILQEPDTAEIQWTRILWLHYALCLVLSTFYIVIFGLQVRTFYAEVFDGKAAYYLIYGRPAQYVLDIVFYAVYACASLEVLIASFFIFVNFRRNSQNKGIPMLFLASIASPLIVSHLITLLVNIVLELTLADFGVIFGLSLTQNVVSGLSLIIILAGLISIAMRAEQASSQLDAGGQALAYPDTKSPMQEFDDSGRPAGVEGIRVGWKDRVFGLGHNLKKVIGYF